MQFSVECHFALHSHSNPTQQKERGKKRESSAKAAPEPCAFVTVSERKTQMNRISLHVLTACV